MIQIGSVQADIRFESGSLERLFADPASVLADAETFWEREEPMRCARGWHTAVGVPVDLERFRAAIWPIASMSPAERESHPALLMTRRVMAEEARFLAEGLPHLCALLPANPATLNIRVLFAGGLRTNAFAHEQVVVNSTSAFWHSAGLSIPERASWVLNLLVHECWHAGYCENQPYWTDRREESGLLWRLLVNLQNEGTATYANYTARRVFPAPADQDFRMLDDPAEIAGKIRMTNTILARREDLDEAALRDLVWTEGVLGRAFYVAGAHMARTIDERLGRKALTDTVAAGPMSFARAYNGAAEAALRLEV
ncbi:MAG: DUF5700 domain-containing putative Zn-dependent protease [Candidatus Bipolaricaulota bacterium]